MRFSSKRTLTASCKAEPEEETVAAMAPVSNRPYEIQIIQESDKHNDKIFTVKVISNNEASRDATDMLPKRQTAK